LCKYNWISVGVEKAKRKRQPLPAGGYSQDVQQKDEQIVRVPRFRRERFVVDEFEVDQPRSSGLLVVNDICRRRIAM
jgi:hypothetical protein